MAPTTAQGRRVEAIAGLAALAFVALGCFVVLKPFLTALAWALILVFATWPVFKRIENFTGGRSSLAAALMTLILVIALIIPMVAVGSGLADSAARLANQVTTTLASGVPEAPAWLGGIPLVGPSLLEQWQSLDSAQIAEFARQYVRPASQWALEIATRIGGGLIELSLSVVVAFFFYRDGVVASRRLSALIERLAGDRAQHLMNVAEGTTRGVVYGVIGTALAQASLAAFGMWFAGIPAWLLLGFVTFFVSIVPPGAPVIWVPATVWLVYTGKIGWGIFMAMWGFFVVSGIDNFLKPYFISRGSTMPLLLVFLGVFGGALAFGFLGVFLGPVLLAVGYTLMREWGSLNARVGDGEPSPIPPRTPSTPT